MSAIEFTTQKKVPFIATLISADFDALEPVARNQTPTKISIGGGLRKIESYFESSVRYTKRKKERKKERKKKHREPLTVSAGGASKHLGKTLSSFISGWSKRFL